MLSSSDQACDADTIANSNTPAILVLSNARCSINSVCIVREVISSTSQDPSSSVDEDTSLPLCIPWTIDTKYYSAATKFWIDVSESNPNSSNDDFDMSMWISSLADAVDAFVYIYDKSEVNPIVLLLYNLYLS